MEIIDRYETAKKIGDKFQFYCVKFIIKLDDDFYVGKWKNRIQSPTGLSQLEDITLIPTKDRGPALQVGWAIASPTDDSFEKTPSLEEYLDPNLEACIEREIEACQLIQQNPHQHLTVYHGCIKTGERALGLSFKRYKQTLAERVDPQRLSKRHFTASGRPLVQDFMRQWLDGLRSALQHLHSMGLVHNDLTPANVMLDENDSPVIIDFGSACHVGESLASVKRTRGWHDEAVTHAAPENDMDALEELRAWMFGSVGHLRFAG